jgi:hypothetical protein
MKFKAMAWQGAALVATALLAGCASEPEVSAGPTLPPPSSVAQAEQRLASVTRERAAIEARFIERERQCYQKFFVTRCVDEAKDRHRAALAAQRQIEIEAERYQRQAKADERDRAMAEADAEYREQEARMATRPAAAPHQATDVPPPRPAPVAERIAKHNAKLKQEQQKEAADADKRAANVREYEERKQESEERQRKVQERLAEKRAKEAKAKGTAPPASQQQNAQPQNPQQPAPNGQ